MFNAEPHGVSNTQFPAKNVRHHHRRCRYRISRVAAAEPAMSGLELMRTTTVVWATAAALLGAGLATSAARADDQIKVGKWEFTVRVPGVTHLPPELLQQYPTVQVGPSGMTISRTECTSSDNPLPAMALPPLARGPSAPQDANHPCKADKTEVSGGTVSWSWNCATAAATIHSEGVIHYHDHGETLDGEYTVHTHTSTAGHPPIERSLSQTVTGRYLGPCEPIP